MTSPGHDHAYAERRRRIAEAYRDDLPGDDEIARARRRHLATSRGGHTSDRPLGRVWAVGLSQGFIVGLVTLAAASLVAAKVLPRWTAWQSHRETEAHYAREPGDPGTRAVRPMESAAPSAAAVSDTVPSAAFVTELPWGTGAKTAQNPLHDDPNEAPAAAMVSAGSGTPKKVPLAVLTPETDPSSLPSLPSSDGPWARVAQALAVGDFTTADAALRALSESGEASARDAAALSRAELWMARGNGALVTSTLERLAETGQTPFIRRRAAELLARARRER
jgi:hypothetical protein